MKKRRNKRQRAGGSRAVIRASAKKPPVSFALACAAAIEIQAAEEGKPAKRPSFTMTAYNGGALRVGAYYRPVVIDLAGMRTRANIPILLDHDSAQIVGQASDVTVTERSVKLAGVITGDDGPAQKVVGHAKNGFQWQASVGVGVDAAEFVDAGQSVKVNGQTFHGPVVVARRSRLAEVSFVAVGADESTRTKVAAAEPGARKERDMGFEAWLKTKGWEKDQLSEEQLATLRAAYDAEQEDAGDEPADPPVRAKGETGTEDEPDEPADPIKAARTAAAAETRRVAKIRTLCAGKHPEIEAKAIEEGWTEDKAELEVMRASRPKAPKAGDAPAATTPLVIEAALALGHGMPEKAVSEAIPQSQREQVMNQAVSAGMRGVGLHYLMDQVIRAAGHAYNGDRRSNDFIRAAFEADRTIRASGGFSTVSLSGILSNVAQKALLNAFQSVTTAVPAIARETDANDFKAFKSYRLTGSGVASEVGPDGELKHVTLQEEEFSNQLGTRGALIALTRQMMVNDDLGAFLQIPTILGRMLAIAREKAVFTLLLSNPSSFFASANGNYIEGADTALSVDGLSLAAQKFWEQKDANGDPILIGPDRLLVPPALKVTADRLHKDAFLNETTTANKGKTSGNPHAGSYQPVMSPFLGSSQALAGASDTAWYLLAPPTSGLAVVEVAYLRGRRVPTVESAETDFSTLGMQWRGYWDFGVAMQEKRAGVKSKGGA